MELKRELHKLGYLPVKLLIVPYGIETRIIAMYFLISYTFNRTLWN